MKNTLAVLEFKYLPSNSMEMFKFRCLNVSKILVGSPGKKTTVREYDTIRE